MGVRYKEKEGRKIMPKTNLGKMSRGKQALKTARWARTMTKWLITYSNKRGVKWQFVEFGGATGAESYGIVDILAVRKDHKTKTEKIKRGDYLDIVLIQTKGGSARLPTDEDKRRLHEVAKHHRAKTVVLAEWKKKEKLNFYKLKKNDWIPVKPKEIFG